jgi:hypothetical protein
VRTLRLALSDKYCQWAAPTGRPYISYGIGGGGVGEGVRAFALSLFPHILMPLLRAVHRLDLLLGEAEAAVPLLVGQKGLAELVFPEVGPQGLGDIEFGVG